MKIVKSENGNIMMVLKEVAEVNEIKVNSVDASFEKHIPQFMIDNDNNQIEVFVNHVMEDDHYIEWILLDYGDMQLIKYFKPSDTPKIVGPYKVGMKAYSYCNKHGLWLNDEMN